MQDDPYQAIASMMQGGDASTLHLRSGVVSGLNPLRVRTCGLTIGGPHLRLNAALLPRTVPVKISTSNGTTSGTLTEQSGGLAVGDEVTLLTEDDQMFIVLCKVVGA